jgi:hypothetical protein
VTHLAETNSPRSVAIKIHLFYLAARMMMPERDWTWLKAIKTRSSQYYRHMPQLSPLSLASSFLALASD